MKLPNMPKRGTAPTAGSATTPTATKADIDLEIEAWPSDVQLLPSALFLGPSGAGKTNAIAQLIMAGFNVCLVPIEDKHAGLNNLKPMRVPIPDPDPNTGRMPSAQTKYDRMWRFVDKLARGDYRVAPDGSPVDILANDGLMEVSQVIDQVLEKKFQTKDSIKRWQMNARKTIDWFNALRDAAGFGAHKFGHRPVGCVATCGEGNVKRVDMDAGGFTLEANEPLLQGNKPTLHLPFQFEIIWRLTAGSNTSGEHVFRVQTVLWDGTLGKSPAGVFDKIVEGPGGLDEEGKPRDPDIGKMYRELLVNPRSPFCHGVVDKEETK